VIDCVVAPVDQRYEEAEEAVSVTEPPAQNAVGPDALMVGAGAVCTVTVVAEDVAEQPFAFVTVTLYAPELLTVIDCVVAPFDQRYEEAEDEVSVTEPPAQNVVGPPAVMVGAGSAFTVTDVAEDVAEQPFASVTVTLYAPASVTVIACVVAPVDQR
jgi:hypothetical protein